MTGLSWLKGKSWSEVTRDERTFCAELYFLARADLPKFIGYLNDTYGADLDMSANWEIAFEAKLYRDERHLYRRGRDKSNPDHRAFDLVLFSNDDILIIEAKAQQGFDMEQLDEFQKAPDRVKRLTGVGRARLSPLVSSRYSPKQNTKVRFTGPYLTWKALASFYDDNPVLRRADEVYGR
jgi:hypothetical protein